MREQHLMEAVFDGVHELKRTGIDLGPRGQIAFSLQNSMMTSCPGMLILPSQS